MKNNDIIIMPMKKLMDYESQPFKVIDNEEMNELVESIRLVGVLTPLIVRNRADELYEVISGHRRKRACQLAGISRIPVIIKELTDDEAAILLVDSNLQRENLLPSEKAYAFRLKLDAIKHQGKKSDISNSALFDESTDWIGFSTDKSGRQVRRYIRLTELIDPLLDKVDAKIIPVTAGAALSFLNVKMQVILNQQLDFQDCKLSIRQAELMKKKFFKGGMIKSKW